MQHFEHENSTSSGIAANGSTGDDTVVAKKINHNAGERDRRKRVNDLYSYLRSLLPISSYHKKKVSIPETVSSAVKYIPELQKEVERLKHKKEKVQWSSSPTINAKQEHLAIKKKSCKTKTNSFLVSSVNVLGDKEVVIQLISSTDHTSTNKEIGFLSKVLENLEHDEDGFVLLNATTMKCSGEGMVLNTLHLQVQGDHKIGGEKLKEQMCSFYQNIYGTLL
ncbi:Achaete-scute transcription factor-related protein [Artemisia annua]|uniref:Achaete-scute transcription factor-related protein n=1 Tax=Artemisia annua TaxID=35608 RepID=A0A2U1KWV3_ARTAN|nr:Achaete-scute transcription factor-related protein [Artemisia annua]